MAFHALARCNAGILVPFVHPAMCHKLSILCRWKKAPPRHFLPGQDWIFQHPLCADHQAKLGDELSCVSPLLGLQIPAGQPLPKQFWAFPRKVAGSSAARAALERLQRRSASWHSHMLVTDARARCCASCSGSWVKTDAKEMWCGKNKSYCGVGSTRRVMYMWHLWSSVRQ